MTRKKQPTIYTLPDEFQAFDFAQDLLYWYDAQKRDLPWRINRDPYRVWVSEIMLQQTRVETVKPYYQNFMQKFPTVEALATAPEEEVLKAWEGLGYYSRARNLQAAAREVTVSYGGVVPDTPEEISKLKGVGPYTAGAILSIAYEVPVPAVDGNVMRVFSRLLLMDDDIAKPATRIKMEQLVKQTIPIGRAGDFNQAIMELGALVCLPKNPQCLTCPVFDYCLARREGVQDTLPVKGKAKPPRPVQLLTAVVKRGNQYLIQKRPEQGLLASLWEFPMVEDAGTKDDEEQLLRLLEKEYGLQVDLGDYLMNVQHTFSHLHWNVDVYVMQHISGEPLKENAVFVTSEEMSQYAFPVLHNKIIAEITAKEEKW
ncbi:A/G-specific adenine glycosylase [Brevibacillus sp. 7WMA2]|uniref:A/G-specific adenine glycosylase n=1 Tax=Brevibacillus TaxID=55080 RepID=UPI0004CE76EF|nr:MULTISPECIES: A/G-specific adenine glycosylase [Brevibacillus]WPS88489.1 A/G-specific adenine glycosylase [Brevibacillus halotolerans]AUM67257.1 A/G-specific adenine glycosylase [Brevibacillus laterosporus]MCR8997223.1 A/G-specific adenine glycosylase [Brevibacillus laterosporus]MDF9413322.1 A/G-specific adenine glycosylase [Brevibacillus laterosporus]PCN42892.1 A/G-specific adenine glycosylase [Brevibacillus laterosporus]